jgi:hypothetical protein
MRVGMRAWPARARLPPSRPRPHGQRHGRVQLTWQPFLNGWGITYTSFDFGNGGGPE